MMKWESPPQSDSHGRENFEEELDPPQGKEPEDSVRIAEKFPFLRFQEDPSERPKEPERLLINALGNRLIEVEGAILAELMRKRTENERVGFAHGLGRESGFRQTTRLLRRTRNGASFCVDLTLLRQAESLAIEVRSAYRSRLPTLTAIWQLSIIISLVALFVGAYAFLFGSGLRESLLRDFVKKRSIDTEVAIDAAKEGHVFNPLTGSIEEIERPNVSSIAVNDPVLVLGAISPIIGFVLGLLWLRKVLLPAWVRDGLCRLVGIPKLRELENDAQALQGLVLQKLSVVLYQRFGIDQRVVFK